MVNSPWGEAVLRGEYVARSPSLSPSLTAGGPGRRDRSGLHPPRRPPPRAHGLGGVPRVRPRPRRQPAPPAQTVWAVDFVCVISLMGIRLVDPIMPALGQQLDATPAQVTLLFTSYPVVTAVAILVTSAISSRIGAKATLVSGLAIIVDFVTLAGASGSIGESVGFRPAGGRTTRCSSPPRWPSSGPTPTSSWPRPAEAPGARSSSTRPPWASASRAPAAGRGGARRGDGREGQSVRRAPRRSGAAARRTLSEHRPAARQQGGATPRGPSLPARGLRA